MIDLIVFLVFVVITLAVLTFVCWFATDVICIIAGTSTKVLGADFPITLKEQSIGDKLFLIGSSLALLFLGGLMVIVLISAFNDMFVQGAI